MIKAYYYNTSRIYASIIKLNVTPFVSTSNRRPRIFLSLSRIAGERIRQEDSVEMTEEEMDGRTRVTERAALLRDEE